MLSLLCPFNSRNSIYFDNHPTRLFAFRLITFAMPGFGHHIFVNGKGFATLLGTSTSSGAATSRTTMTMASCSSPQVALNNGLIDW